MQGGLDLVTPRIARSTRPGGLTLCVNHEARDEGYRRIDGFERFDGRPPPSELAYPVPMDTEIDRKAKLAAIDIRRKAIGEVPGHAGHDPAGVWRFNEKTYAFKRKALPADDASAVIGMYSSSAAGWQEVDLGFRFHFTDGAGEPPLVGTVLTGAQSGHTVTIQRLVRLSGDFEVTHGDAAGFCLVRNTSAGQLMSGELVTWTAQTTGTDLLRVESAVRSQAINWADGARFRGDNHNFYGQDSTERMYGVTGTDYGFEYDGTLWTPLITGAANDTPNFIAVHQEHVFLGYSAGSLVHSALGEAVNFEAVEGAAEFGAGETMTNLLSGYRNSLFIFGVNQIAILQGTSTADWRLFVFDREAGAMADTVALLSEPTGYDDRGIRGVAAVDAYGDFSVASMSAKIRPIFDRKRSSGALPTAVARVRAKSQYRLYFDDGDIVVMGLNEGSTGRVYHNFSISRYELNGAVVIVQHVCSVEDGDGREVIFFTIRGSSYVYQMERGINFDGQQIRAIMQSPFNDFGSPALIKRFRKMLVECDAADTSRFRLAADFDDGKAEGARDADREFTISTRGGRWDEVNWSEFAWSGSPENLAQFRIKGRGRNIAPVIYSRGDDIPPYVVSGMTVLYDIRKTMR